MRGGGERERVQSRNTCPQEMKYVPRNRLLEGGSDGDDGDGDSNIHGAGRPDVLCG